MGTSLLMDRADGAGYGARHDGLECIGGLKRRLAGQGGEKDGSERIDIRRSA